MSANPPIAAIADQTQSLSPNENIHRYLHSIPPNQAKVDVNAPPTPPLPDGSSDPLSPSGEERSSHLVQRVNIVDGPAIQSRDRAKAQLGDITDKWRRESREHHEYEAEAEQPSHTRYTIDETGQGPSRHHGNAVHQAEDEDLWETESATRRADRRIRRQHRAAIFKPKPSPQPKRGTKRPAPDPSSSLIGSGSTREARTQAKIMKKMPPLLRTYNPPNVFVSGRLTTKPQRPSRPLFYGKAVESRPFPGGPVLHRNANAASSQHDFHDIKRGSNYVPSAIASPPRYWNRPPLRTLHPHQPSPPPTNSYHSTIEQGYPLSRSYSYHKRPDTIPNAYDYSRLPQPGLTNSPSWPTNPSDIQSSKLDGPRTFEPQLPVPPARIQKPPSTYSRTARSELQDITFRGQWRWPPDHSILQQPKPVKAIRRLIGNDSQHHQESPSINITPRSAQEKHPPSSTSDQSIPDPTSSSPLFRLDDASHVLSYPRSNVIQGTPIGPPSGSDQLWKPEQRSRSGEDEPVIFWQQRQQPSLPYDRDRGRDHVYDQQENQARAANAEFDRDDWRPQERIYSPAPSITRDHHRSPEPNGIHTYVPPGRVQHPEYGAPRQNMGFDGGYGIKEASMDERRQERQEVVNWNNDGWRRQEKAYRDESTQRSQKGDIERYELNEDEWKAAWRREM